MRLWQAAALMGVLVVASGCSGRSSSANQQPDPAVRAASSVMMLERTSLPVTKEQAGRLLPLFRALRGSPATDRSAAKALVSRIDKILTDAQRVELKRLRAQQGPGTPAPPGGAPGSGGLGPGGSGNPGSPPPAFGPGGQPGTGPGGPGQPGAGPPSAEQMAAFRGQILDRTIALLEARSSKPGRACGEGTSPALSKRTRTHGGIASGVTYVGGEHASGGDAVF